MSASPSIAQQQNQSVSREDAEICFDKLVACVVDCGWWLNPGNYEACNKECNEDYGICVRGDGAAQLSVHVAPVAEIDNTELERVCQRVDGIFRGTKKTFGCMNELCDGKGNCSVICHDGRCLATTPDELPNRLTLIGILQNGDNVDHGGGRGGGSLVDSPAGDEGCVIMDGSTCYD